MTMFSVRPMSAEQMTSVTATKGDSEAEISCAVESRPASVINWVVNNTVIDASDKKYNVSNTSVVTTNCGATKLTSTLKIYNISEKDAGSITCAAKVETNTVELLSQTANLTVQCMYDA